MPTPTIDVIVNGETRLVPQGETVLELLKTLDLEPDRVAVELDREILKPHLWEGTRLQPGARLEIVQFVGGG